MSYDSIDLVSIEMGYGHLRPAYALSNFLENQPILVADGPPLASPEEAEEWHRARRLYEALSRAGNFPLIGRGLGDILDAITQIPSMYPRRDLSDATLGAHLLRRAGRRGMGRGLAARLERENKALLTTFYAPAVLSHEHQVEGIYCIVTDSDVNRVWAPIDARRSRIHYLAPTERVRRRLKAYGVPSNRISVTGFPLPHELVGGPGAAVLKQNLRRRLAALDPRKRFLRECRDEIKTFLGEGEMPSAPPHLVFAVGGAGAQSDMAHVFLPSLARRIRKGKLKVTLVAGIRPEVELSFRRAIEKAALLPELEAGRIRILLEKDHRSYFSSFNRLLADADILWTKPSELTFFGALGIPLLFSEPVGSHERENRRFSLHAGAGVKQFDPSHTGDWLGEMLKDGTLAGAAWSGYLRMPKFGLYRIVEEVLGTSELETLLRKSDANLEAPRFEFVENVSSSLGIGTRASSPTLVRHETGDAPETH